MINWKQKLSSRKFWAAITGFVSSILIAFNVPEMTAQQIITVIGGISTLIVYILAEGYVDESRSDNNADIQSKG